MCNWQTVVPRCPPCATPLITSEQVTAGKGFAAPARCPPCATPLITSEQVPQIPSRQSESNPIGSSPRAINCSFTTSSISRNDMSGMTSLAWYSTRRPALAASFCLQTFSVKFIALFIAPLRHVNFFIDERFLLQNRGSVGSLVFPGRDKGEILIVALGLAVGGLVFDAKMAAAR